MNTRRVVAGVLAVVLVVASVYVFGRGSKPTTPFPVPSRSFDAWQKEWEKQR